jgi:hypothetical protein
LAQRRPHPSLFAPAERGDDRSIIGFLYGVAAAHGTREEQDLFLQVVGQVQLRHDLRHPRRGDAAKPGQFRRVRHDAVAD